VESERIMLLAALALWSAGFLLAGRLRPCSEVRGSDLSSAPSVLIPARNEEHNLPALLRSLASQPVRPREVLIVDDSSTDRTAELARQLGATVIASKPLPHIPHIEDEHPLTREDYLAFKERVVDKLERMGLKDLRKHVVFEHCWTPLDIRQQYYSNQGAIYGVVSDRFKNLAFKAPKQSTKYPNLFFVGGSVNPGGGMPMVVLCGQNVARKVVAWDRG